MFFSVDIEKFIFFACDVYILYILSFYTVMSCDIYQYVTLMVLNLYNLKITRTVTSYSRWHNVMKMLRYESRTLWYFMWCYIMWGLHCVMLRFVATALDHFLSIFDFIDYYRLLYYRTLNIQAAKYSTVEASLLKILLQDVLFLVRHVHFYHITYSDIYFAILVTGCLLMSVILKQQNLTLFWHRIVSPVWKADIMSLYFSWRAMACNP